MLLMLQGRTWCGTGRWGIDSTRLDAYSDEVVHPFRAKPSKCSGPSRPGWSGDPEGVLDTDGSGVVGWGVGLIGRVVEPPHGAALEGDAVGDGVDAPSRRHRNVQDGHLALLTI